MMTIMIIRMMRLAENERLADTEQADVQAEALDTEADENEAAGTENDAADSGDEQ